MFKALNAFYSDRVIPRPYDAILEEHRALAATDISRTSGRAVNLDSLGGSDKIPYSEDIRWYLIRSTLKTKS
jgi:hypothetical protein